MESLENTLALMEESLEILKELRDQAIKHYKGMPDWHSRSRESDRFLVEALKEHRETYALVAQIKEFMEIDARRNQNPVLPFQLPGGLGDFGL
jgi:hypothetical protein